MKGASITCTLVAAVPDASGCSMRLYTVLSLGLPRSVLPGGLDVCGRWFPEGTEVSVPQLSVHRNTEIWGDANVFRPERFLEEGASEKGLRKYLVSFGMGSRACVSPIWSDCLP